jgi:hypothetical protein
MDAVEWINTEYYNERPCRQRVIIARADGRREERGRGSGHEGTKAMAILGTNLTFQNVRCNLKNKVSNGLWVWIGETKWISNYLYMVKGMGTLFLPPGLPA